MKHSLIAGLLLIVLAGTVRGQGLLIPEDRSVPPLAMVNHRVQVNIENQVAVTRVEQSFRNHTPRPLEATYVFPLPRGASVTEFAMWVDGKRVKGELVEAAKAKQIYTDIVRRILDPGLLEYIGSDLLKLHVFPVPPRGEQKVELSYTSLARQDHDIVEYVYPVRTDAKAARTLEDFSLKVTLKSDRPILSIYSPTHAISMTRPDDRNAVVGFEKNQCLLDKDFQLIYTLGGGDVGLSTLFRRVESLGDGYFLFLIAPRPDFSKGKTAPRDFVFALDTSGSMAEDGKLDQARKALGHCLGRLTKEDRFAILQFATTVNRYAEGLKPANPEEIESAKKWLGKLEAVGGTAIDDALQAAFDLRNGSDGRDLIISFFTDGKPTIGETVPDTILDRAAKKNAKHVRVFTFGVGHGVNAALLDRLAEMSGATSTYVRPGEEMEAKVSGFFAKISHPALTNLQLSVTRGSVRLVELYPPKLGDLFHGEQLVALGRYQGEGETAVKLSGLLGGMVHEFSYPIIFPARAEGKEYVEDLWARRKVGYLLEQLRLGGEKKELVDEVVTLAKKYGIATPYTSWLVVPDMPMPIVRPFPRPPIPRPFPPTPPILLRGGGVDPIPLAEAAGRIVPSPGAVGGSRGDFERDRFAALPKDAKGDRLVLALQEAMNRREAYDATRGAWKAGMVEKTHSDKLGVDLAIQVGQLKTLTRVPPTAVRNVAGRSLIEVGGVWIDARFDAKAPIVVVRAMSDAYFRILERRPEMKEVFALGNHLVWVAPSGGTLIIDVADGRREIADREIDTLFTKK